MIAKATTTKYHSYIPPSSTLCDPFVWQSQLPKKKERGWWGIVVNVEGNVSVNATPKWQTDAIKKIASLGQLPRNWDGYGSPPPSEDVRQWAVDVALRTNLGSLQPPEFYPEPDGNLELDWRSGRNREIELHIESGQIEYLKVETGQPLDEGTFAPDDDNKLYELLTWLRNG